MDLVELGDLIMHTPWLTWLNRLLIRVGLISKELHDLFCQRGCEISEVAW